MKLFELNKDNDIVKFYAVEFLIAIILAISCALSYDKIVVEDEVEGYFACDRQKLEDGKQIYSFDLADRQEDETDVVFYTVHNNVEVKFDGKTEYESFKVRDIWGSTPGAVHHIVQLPPDVSHVDIYLYPVYEQVYYQDIDIYLCDASVFVRNKIAESVPAAVVSLFIIVTGVFMLGYWVFAASKERMKTTSFHLAVFAIVVGVWSLNETTVMELIISNRSFCTFVSYNSLMLINIPFIMFLKDFLELKDSWQTKVANSLAGVLYAVVLILNFTGIREYRENLIYIQGMLIVTFLYGAIGVIVKIKRNEFGRRVGMVIMSLLLLLLSLAIDFIGYYVSIGDADSLGRYMFLVFILILMWELNIHTNSIMEKSRRNKELESFALTDSMTGMYNRNAYNQHIAQITNPRDLLYIAIDLNNLKECNDSYGHQIGDEYLSTCADLIDTVFGEIGNCYRVGGDEFCVLVKDSQNIAIDRYINRLVVRTAAENSKFNKPYKIEMALGYARFDPSKDRSLQETIGRADKLMYEIKRKQKATRKSDI